MTAVGERLLKSASVFAAPSFAGRFDKLGVVIFALAAAALPLEPFATLKANRIVSGKGLSFFDALPAAVAEPAFGLLLAAAILALLRTRPELKLVAGAVAIIAILALIGLVPGHVVPPEASLARVAPASGFWILIFAFAILVADAMARLELGPVARVSALAAAALVVGAILGSGLWNGLSVLKEYAAHSDAFWREGATHVELAFSSLAAAVLAGLPLGVACQRSPALRSATLPVLNIIQTVPSIAMYGLMMAPLGLLAARFPVLQDFGVRGIGAAPALIALFLYSLLPVTANVVVGLEQAPAEVVEAAKGMGMTGSQRLLRVELPLAFPVILTGIRVVLVQNIGLVTVAALIGGGGFGELVFQGIGQSANDLVLLGAAPTIALAFIAAILLDALIEWLDKRKHP